VRTKFEYTINGANRSEEVAIHSVFAYNNAVSRLLKIADAGSLRATSV
jgi:hypothetical protein